MYDARMRRVGRHPLLYICTCVCVFMYVWVCGLVCCISARVCVYVRVGVWACVLHQLLLHMRILVK